MQEIIGPRNEGNRPLFEAASRLDRQTFWNNFRGGTTPGSLNIHPEYERKLGKAFLF